ncbi:phage portal protein [Pseudovibrio sp. Tun.PSC04-5.I4]|uniref:phage portal protein n=1 Tax=Pseudovibrio sp. Tun.PSC04-5.I4 TaxID=1798213 RepID=UPI00087EFBDC|nr:phage portal protein [Pseudovibrio sp. Tun.PSC04-5.I4]SDQ99573.1 phage portal protein, lambda family [Pseudovibrio sp. Tun.PSC04-5.I4]
MAATKAKLIDVFGNEIGPVRPAARMGGGRAFEAASNKNQSLTGWRPPRTSPQDALSADRPDMMPRIQDLARNNPWAASAITKKVDGIVGTGINFSSKPDALALGLTEEEAVDLASAIEDFWRAHVNDVEHRCDATMRLDGVGLMALAVRHWLQSGEALATICWRERGGQSHTAIKLIHSDRLRQPMGKMPTPYFRDGLELGKDGEALAYNFSEAHPDDRTAYSKRYASKRIQKFNQDGSRRVLHHFLGGDVGEIRGRPPMAPITKKLRQLGKFDEVELDAAILNAVLAAFVTSDSPDNILGELLEDEDHGKAKVEQLLDAMEVNRSLQRTQNPIEIPGVRLGQLAIGESINFTNPARPSGNYESFELAALRNIASAFGVSVEWLTGDYSKLSYSGFRGSMLNVWRGITSERSGFISSFVAPWFCAVVEEGIATGKIFVPRHAVSFWKNKSAYCKGRWLGPGRGSADPLKDAKAAEIGLGTGLVTMEDELAAVGKDYEDQMKRLEQEIKDHERIGLIHPRLQGKQSELLETNPDEDKDNE